MTYTIDNPKLVACYFYVNVECFTGVVKDERGDIAYYVDGEYHREDGPAVIWSDGFVYYFQHGERHRTDGPAVIYPNGGVEYYLNNNLHREDGPARIHLNGIKEYWLNNKQISVSTDQELKDYLILRMFE